MIHSRRPLSQSNKFSSLYYKVLLLLFIVPCAFSWKYCIHYVRTTVFFFDWWQLDNPPKEHFAPWTQKLCAANPIFDLNPAQKVLLMYEDLLCNVREWGTRLTPENRWVSLSLGKNIPLIINPSIRMKSHGIHFMPKLCWMKFENSYRDVFFIFNYYKLVILF